MEIANIWDLWVQKDALKTHDLVQQNQWTIEEEGYASTGIGCNVKSVAAMHYVFTRAPWCETCPHEYHALEHLTHLLMLWYDVCKTDESFFGAGDIFFLMYIRWRTHSPQLIHDMEMAYDEQARTEKDESRKILLVTLKMKVREYVPLLREFYGQIRTLNDRYKNS